MTQQVGRFKTKTQLLHFVDSKFILQPAHKRNFVGTKVCVTLGPASRDVNTLCELLAVGMSCARISLTWGTLEYHLQTLRNLKEAMQQTQHMCAVMVDIMGREFTIRRPMIFDADGWPKHDSLWEVKQGDEITITCDPQAEYTPEILPVSYPRFAELCQPGDHIHIGRYLTKGATSALLEVKSNDSTEVKCVALNSVSLDGLLTVYISGFSNPAIVGMRKELPLFSNTDIKGIHEIKKVISVDFLCAAFAYTHSDLQTAQDMLKDAGMEDTKLLVKLESKEALYCFKQLLESADGVILSRDALSFDLPPQKIPITQKAVIQQCNLKGKPVLITSIVESMTNSPRPTRAEATDIANAVLDGVDGLILGAESLRGNYPIQTVETIQRICGQAEEVFDYKSHFELLMEQRGIEPENLDEDTIVDSHPADGLAFDWFYKTGMTPATSFKQMNDSFNSLKHGQPTPMETLYSGLISSNDSHGRQLRALGDESPHKQSDFNSHHDIIGMKKRTAWGSQQVLAKMHSKGSIGRMSDNQGQPYFDHPEALASSAVRAADKIDAKLLIVITDTGRTASLVSKYRPPVPILTVVAPKIKSDQTAWHLSGIVTARQCCLLRGVLPVLGMPRPGKDPLMSDAIMYAVLAGLVGPGDHIVSIFRERSGHYILQAATVQDNGRSVKQLAEDKTAPMIRTASIDVRKFGGGAAEMVGTMVGYRQKRDTWESVGLD
eukprot:TRINITY_DN7603_c0_g2_i3.p1 TRINITY_DN7603_c0_g2~~TRINITY_DN7603_c0_g2_i3.p1  ORF type:complete len:756 (-),score=102.15 TRINITY_DN7603_c0_g2_i3:382-2541(-)